jgi:hypothetical protein
MPTSLLKLSCFVSCVVVAGCGSKWGTLANPGFDGQRIRTILFFAGEQLDGKVLPQNNCPPPSTENITAGCQTAWPLDQRYLDWTRPENRALAISKVTELGFNTLSMSTWGESWLPCTTECPSVPTACCGKGQPDAQCDKPVPRCFFDQAQRKICRIGWPGAANTQLSPAAKDELMDAALQYPVLVIPFIESRFDYDWNFRTDFPTSTDPRFPRQLAPGLISQIVDLIDTYLTHPRNPRWADKWAMVYDRNGEKRYAVAIVQASSDTIGPDQDQEFAAAFDGVANEIEARTHKKIGFFIDPIPRNPQSTYGCPGVTGPPVSTYGARFKPDPETTGPFLAERASILGIHAYSPEGWIDGNPFTGPPVEECVKREWKRDFSERWYRTGIPFLQDVTPGYDGSRLFTSSTNLHRWGYNDEWRNTLLDLVRRYGRKGMVYNSWNGYCEGLAGMETWQQGSRNVDFIRTLMATYAR